MIRLKNEKVSRLHELGLTAMIISFFGPTMLFIYLPLGDDDLHKFSWFRCFPLKCIQLMVKMWFLQLVNYKLFGLKKIYIRPRDLDCKFVLSILDTILEALSFLYVWKLKKILDEVDNFCLVKQEDGSLADSEDCNGEYQEMVTRWWWTTAAASIFFSFFYSIALL